MENTRRLFQYKTPKPTAPQPLHSTNAPLAGRGTPHAPGHSTPRATPLPGSPNSPSSPPTPFPARGSVGDARGPRLGRSLPAPGRRLGGGRRGGSGCGAGIPTPQQAGLVSAGGSRPPSFPTRFYSLHCPIAAGRAPGGEIGGGGGAGAEHTWGPSSQPPPGSEELGKAEPPAPASPWDPLLGRSLPSPPLGCSQCSPPKPAPAATAWGSPTCRSPRLLPELGSATKILWATSAMLRHPGEGPELPRAPLKR